MSRLAWLLAVMAALPATAGAQTIAAEQHACDLRPSAARHEGEILVFRGRYSSAGRERARIGIVGCSDRYAVGSMAEGVDKAMDPHVMPGFYPAGQMDALFSARIDLVRPSDAAYQNDDGVRLTILEASDIVPVAD